jgi:glycosyltransferase involved in cell wall biosynthesis
MAFADAYFSKQKGFKPFFSESPSEDLRYIVVIPAYREPDLTGSLDSLFKCTPPEGHVEVIIVINIPENADQTVVLETRKNASVASGWIKDHNRREFRFLLIPFSVMPAKEAGVGFARKMGMDQALYRFNSLNNPRGHILSFDADSQCDTNYFTAIEETIQKHPLTKGFNLYFEHPLSGNDYPAAVYRGITLYEMHLRYLNLFVRYTGFPHAFHTVGSCFGVRADVYAGQGGMSKKKAGEDFYFLQKIIPLGGFREINNTCVMPSPRESDRVPFGTGAAIHKYLKSQGSVILTYAPACFFSLRSFFMLAGSLYTMSEEEVNSAMNKVQEPLRTYLFENRASEAIREIRANSGSLLTFTNRFFKWFDAFRIIKYLNYASRTSFRQISTNQAVRDYLQVTGMPAPPENTAATELLNLLRKIERSRA